MLTVTKIIKFDAAHRLYKYNGACSNIHGHGYRAEITYSGIIDSLGMVKDFKDIKAEIGSTIMSTFDHALVLNKEDPLARILAKRTRLFLMEGNPTAENMAMYILQTAKNIIKVRIWETDTSFAEVQRDYLQG